MPEWEWMGCEERAVDARFVERLSRKSARSSAMLKRVPRRRMKDYERIIDENSVRHKAFR